MDTDQDVVEYMLHDADYLLNNVDDLKGEDHGLAEDILNMDMDELDSDDDMSTSRDFPVWWQNKGSSLGLFWRQSIG